MDLQAFWDNKLKGYADQSWSREPSIFVKEVERFFPKKSKILDLGAGAGQDIMYLKSKDFEVTALDISEFSRQKIKEKCGEADFILADMGKPLKVQSASYDVVYSHLGIHYFNKQRTIQLFKEIHKILKPNGIIAILVNSIKDPEIKECREIEKDYYIDSKMLEKRYFSEESLKEMVDVFETLLLDDNGTSKKDELKKVSGLIRFVGRKV